MGRLPAGHGFQAGVMGTAPSRRYVSRFTLTNKGTPEVGRRVGLLQLESELSMTQGICSPLACGQATVELLHQLSGARVVDGVEAHHQSPRPSGNKGPLEAVDALTIVDVTQAGLTGRQHDQRGL